MGLFKPGERVCSGRVCLSSLSEDGLATMPWLGAALAPEWSVADLERALAASEAALISDTGGAPIGLALVRLDTPAKSEVTITFLAVQPERRYRGLGGEAGLAIERLMRERNGVHRVYAGVPEGRGLAVYFWLRLGFRPLSTAESPKTPLGLRDESAPGMWMLRASP